MLDDDFNFGDPENALDDDFKPYLPHGRVESMKIQSTTEEDDEVVKRTGETDSDCWRTI